MLPSFCRRQLYQSAQTTVFQPMLKIATTSSMHLRATNAADAIDTRNMYVSGIFIIQRIAHKFLHISVSWTFSSAVVDEL